MATYYRGIGDFKEALITRRRGLANQLANDDKRRERGERTGLLSRTARDTLTGEILGFNWVIQTIAGSSVLTEEEYDRAFGPRGTGKTDNPGAFARAWTEGASQA